MSPSDYSKIKRQLNHRHSAWPSLLILAADAVLLGLAAYLIAFFGVPGCLVSSPLLAVVGFHAFGILHECGHGNVSRRKWVNAFIGHAVSPLTFLPYYPWKYIHTEHHRWTGNMEKDPTLHALRERRKVGRFSWFHQAVWMLWLPLAGMVQHGVFWGYPVRLAMQPETKRRVLIECCFSVLWIALAWTTILMLLPTQALLYAVLPGIYLFFLIDELVNLPHHSDQPVFSSDDANARLAIYDQHLTTRSCDYPRGLSEFFFLNFNYHVEHHLFPSLPWHRLRKAQRLIKAELGDDYTEAVGAEWNIENRKKDPAEVLLKERRLHPPQRKNLWGKSHLKGRSDTTSDRS